MAKPTKKTIEILAAIAKGEITHISKDAGIPLLQNDPPLIQVDTDNLDGNSNAAVRLTDAGAKLVPAQKNASPAPASPYAIIKNAVLPPSKRGNKGGGAPAQYPFDSLEVGDTFFVPVSEKHPDPVKTLGSTVSSANNRYAVKTGETKRVNKAERGPDKKAILVNGKKVMHEVEVPVYKYERKFVIRGVKKSEKYGEFVAPADGALIGREA